MSGLKFVKRFERIEMLIKLRNTGNPRELSNKLGVSERSVYRIINDFKLYNPNDIQYSKYYKSYVFVES